MGLMPVTQSLRAIMVAAQPEVYLAQVKLLVDSHARRLVSPVLLVVAVSVAERFVFCHHSGYQLANPVIRQMHCHFV